MRVETSEVRVDVVGVEVEPRQCLVGPLARRPLQTGRERGRHGRGLGVDVERPSVTEGQGRRLARRPRSGQGVIRPGDGARE